MTPPPPFLILTLVYTCSKSYYVNVNSSTRSLDKEIRSDTCICLRQFYPQCNCIYTIAMYFQKCWEQIWSIELVLWTYLISSWKVALSMQISLEYPTIWFFPLKMKITIFESIVNVVWQDAYLFLVSYHKNFRANCSAVRKDF